MPLSKERDRERKRLIRLETKKIQPKTVIPGLVIEGNRIVGIKSRLETEPVQPKYDEAWLYPDGRVRTADMKVVQPKQVIHIRPYSKQAQLKRVSKTKALQ